MDVFSVNINNQYCRVPIDVMALPAEIESDGYHRDSAGRIALLADDRSPSISDSTSSSRRRDQASCVGGARCGGGGVVVSFDAAGEEPSISPQSSSDPHDACAVILSTGDEVGTTPHPAASVTAVDGSMVQLTVVDDDEVGSITHKMSL